MIRKRYSSEFKAQAVELVGLGKPVPEVPRNWAWALASSTAGWVKVRRLRRENTSLKLENDILKKGCGHPRDQKPADARAMIVQIAQQTGGSTHKVCAVLGRPRSSYYHAATPTASQLADAQIGDLIESVFKRHRRRYGYRRIAQELADRDVVCAPARIRRIMAQRGLHAIAPRNFVPKTSDGRADRPSPNLLAGKPLPAAPDRVWAGDICQHPPVLPFGLPAAGYLAPFGSFIPTSSGWLYLAIIIDLYSRRIVGWSLADHLRTDLVLAALAQAVQTRCARHVIFHSDRGSQYGSIAFRQALRAAGMLQSMSARANPYDNAEDARAEIFAYIEGYYNTHRKHSSLKYYTPMRFEAYLHSTN